MCNVIGMRRFGVGARDLRFLLSVYWRRGQSGAEKLADTCRWWRAER